MKKRENAIYIGFAAESENLLENARKKLNSKNVDFLIANEIIGDKGAIGKDEAEVFLLNKFNADEMKFEYDNKKKIAKLVLDKTEELIKLYKPSFIKAKK